MAKGKGQSRRLDVKVAKLINGTEQAVLLALDEVGEKSVAKMREVIRNSVSPMGLERFKAGRGRGPGREDTGSMYDDARYRTEPGDGNRISLAVGWINNFQEYYKYQEEGFKNQGVIWGLRSGNLDAHNGPFHWDNFKSRAKPQQGIWAKRAAYQLAANIAPALIKRRTKNVVKFAGR